MTITDQIRHMAEAEFWAFLAFAAILAGVCFYFAFNYLKKSRLIEDTPTSKIRSAAQGYVELEGNAKTAEEFPIVSPLTDSHCCWYRYEIERKSDKNWRTVEKGSSEHAFVIEDETGNCIVLPKGAEVTASDRSVWYGKTRQPENRNPPKTAVKMSVGSFQVKVDDFSASFKGGFSFTQYRYTEERIYAGDHLYAMGHFTSLQDSDHHRKKNEMAKEILRRWKLDQDNMLNRFDTDGDGRIDNDEWDNARQSAHRIAGEKYDAEKDTRIYHTLSKSPVKGYPFLLSTLPQFALAKRYKTASAFLLAGFLLFGVGATVLITSRF
jgi:hypothetical protein